MTLDPLAEESLQLSTSSHCPLYTYLVIDCARGKNDVKFKICIIYYYKPSKICQQIIFVSLYNSECSLKFLFKCSFVDIYRKLRVMAGGLLLVGFVVIL
jgi:hypothetical protein